MYGSFHEKCPPTVSAILTVGSQSVVLFGEGFGHTALLEKVCHGGGLQGLLIWPLYFMLVVET